jgi:hypothetical protein
MSRRLLKKGAHNGYTFDGMGYATPRLNDKAAMAALQIVTKQAPVIAKVQPLGDEYYCHRNAVKFAPELGGKPIRGYRVELSLFGFLEVVDHSVVDVNGEHIDVTPYHGTRKSMFVRADRELPTIQDAYVHPYGGRESTTGKPCFVIPLTCAGQRAAVESMGSYSAMVGEARLWDEGALTRSNTIVMRF